MSEWKRRLLFLTIRHRIISSRVFVISSRSKCTSRIGTFSKKELSYDVHVNSVCKIRCLSSITSAASSTCLEDFFGESVTFIHPVKAIDHDDGSSKNEAIEALDSFQLGIITRGKTCFEGGDSEGDSIQASHSAAMVWANILRQAFAFNGPDSRSLCPMLTVAAIAPLLCQTGVDYVRYLDRCLMSSSRSNNFNVSSSTDILILPMAQRAVQHLHSNSVVAQTPNLLSNREILHLEALHELLQNRHQDALSKYLHILSLHPGDVLALALAMDVAYVVGKPVMALRAATSVSRYIEERRQRGASFSSLFISGYNAASAWVSLGLALGGKYRDAESLAQMALGGDSSSSGGIAAAALSVLYDGEGRITEGASLLVGFDGIQRYKDCGWLGYDVKLAGWGARFVLDRDGESGGNLALRIYDDYFGDRLTLPAASFAQRTCPHKTQGFVRRAVKAGESGGKTILQTLFGFKDKTKSAQQESDIISTNIKEYKDPPSHNIVALESFLTFLPPTPQFLTDATLLLLRLTLAGVISENDERWNTLKDGWKSILSELQKDTIDGYPLDFFPLADALSALLADTNEQDNFVATSYFKQGLFELGKLMALGRNSTKESKSQPLPPQKQKEWSRVVSLLSSAVEGREWATSRIPSAGSGGVTNTTHLAALDQDLRPIIDHAICHAALISKTYESLNIARSICSESVTLRPNCAESWWRYSIVLDELGDTVAAQNARMACKTFGSGVRNL